MSGGKGSALKAVFAFIIAPLIVTVISGLIFEWYRARPDKTVGASATVTPSKSASPVSLMIIGKWSKENSSMFGERSVEFTDSGQIIRTTEAFSPQKSTNYKYTINDAGELVVETGTNMNLIKLTDDELILS